MKKKLPKVGEFGLIEKLKKFQRSSTRIVRGIGDDAAVLELDRRRYQLFTTDMLVEDVHFLGGVDPAALGHKAMAVNISDIAAMGGRPTFAVVSIGVPSGLSSRYIEAVYRGMRVCADRFGASIVGGDTVSADKLVINVALLGEVEKGRLVLRSGARPGDRIFVTGPLGGSLAFGRHLRFAPRLREARFLVERFRPSAMIDISDGLAGDLGHILRASGLSAWLDEERIPRRRGVTLEAALRDGEDFELLFTLSSLKAKKLLECKSVAKDFNFIDIGEIVAGHPGTRAGGLFLRDRCGIRRAVEMKGYTHF
ncbi:MAG: thiamine-phosphate kinase [Candidatus Omnitrophica bacterium]|nr:thiamine-phosphate kinase [Candidatus Omnitrophota bacterium]